MQTMDCIFYTSRVKQSKRDLLSILPKIWKWATSASSKWPPSPKRVQASQGVFFLNSFVLFGGLFMIHMQVVIEGLSRKSPTSVNGLSDIYVTQQPRRVDWNAHARKMTTSLYWSVGVVDAVEGAMHSNRLS